MVQVIGQEGIGELLGQGLGSGLSGGLQMLMEAKMKGMQNQSLIQGLTKNDSNGVSGKATSGEPKKYSTEELLIAEKTLPGAAKILKDKEDRDVKAWEKTEGINHMRDTLGSMYKLIDKTGPVAWLDPNNQEARQEFESLRMTLIDKGTQMEGKGVISKPKFESLLKTMPSKNKTQAQNRGAIKAWNKVLKLNMPEFEELKLNVVSPGTKITTEIVDEILKKTGNDLDKARKMAKEAGYEF